MIFLVGFMGAGKTTAGRLLAARLGWDFLDLDDVIEKRARRAVREIFEQVGEAGFRQVEAKALTWVLARRAVKPLVLALGGGAFVQPRNAEALRATALPVVFLDAEPEELRRRCELPGNRRPLFQDAKQFEQLYVSRREAYLAAGARLDTTGLTPEAVVAELLRVLKMDSAEKNSTEMNSTAGGGSEPISLRTSQDG